MGEMATRPPIFSAIYSQFSTECSFSIMFSIFCPSGFQIALLLALIFFEKIVIFHGWCLVD